MTDETLEQPPKRCSHCRRVKPLSEFGKDKRRRDGLQCQCRDCRQFFSRAYYLANEEHIKAYQQRYRAEHGDRTRALQRQWLYGIDQATYDALWAEQGGLCGVCGVDLIPNNKQTHLDHDHSCCPGARSCGRCIRGLVCHHCNTALGLFKDDVTRLRAAIAYLERGRPQALG